MCKEDKGDLREGVTKGQINNGDGKRETEKATIQTEKMKRE